MAQAHAPRDWPRLAASWSAQWVLYLGLWLVFTASAAPAELIAGGVSAAIAATLCAVVWRQPLARLALEPALFAHAAKLPGAVLRDTAAVLSVLARHTRGAPAPSLLRVVRFDPGPREDPRAATRRALAVAFNSLTPNTLVLGIDLERGLLLFHQLQPGPVPELARELGARE